MPIKSFVPPCHLKEVRVGDVLHYECDQKIAHCSCHTARQRLRQARDFGQAIEALCRKRAEEKKQRVGPAEKRMDIHETYLDITEPMSKGKGPLDLHGHVIA